ncbi:MAG: glutamate racemase [Clostridia bacterium]|nr:glutamate racemase [Clostridia bacterium]
MDRRPVGFFDSGLGGLSVLREAVKILPHENFIFFGDNKNAPYGDKTRNEVASLTADATDFLVSKGVKAVVLACNTATAASVFELRKSLTLPIISVEPAIKPACEAGGDGSVLMLATLATTHLERYIRLKGRMQNPSRIIDIPCPGLVERIEKGIIGVGEFDDILEKHLSPYYGIKVDAIVLGCTHYVFIGEAVREFALRHFSGDCKLYDGGAGTARQLGRRLRELDLENDSGCGDIEFCTSGDMNTYRPIFEKLMKI